MSSLSTAVISFAIAAGLAGALAETTSGKAARQGPDFPLAALSWAQNNCGSTLFATPGTPRIHADDFIRVSADYDAHRAADGLAAACNRALTSARRVAHAG